MSDPGTTVPPNLLIVDDDDAFRERLAMAFRKREFQVRTASDAEQAIQAATADSPELAIVDLRMPGEGGLYVVQQLHAIDVTTKIVVLTAYGSIATALEAVRLGAVNFLQKPATVEEILLAFERTDAARAVEPSAPLDVPSLARAEWEHINRVLLECGGNVRKAARLLGLHRRTLQRKLAKHPSSS